MGGEEGTEYILLPNINAIRVYTQNTKAPFDCITDCMSDMLSVKYLNLCK